MDVHFHNDSLKTRNLVFFVHNMLKIKSNLTSFPHMPRHTLTHTHLQSDMYVHVHTPVHKHTHTHRLSVDHIHNHFPGIAETFPADSKPTSESSQICAANDYFVERDIGL